MTGTNMEQNRSIQINWGTFNVPTILSIAAILWYTAQHSERQDARLDSLETNRAARSVEVNKTLEALQTKTNPVESLQFKMTIMEQGLADVNRRVDRVGDSMQSIRDDVANVSTQVQLLNQKFDTIFPGAKPRPPT